MKLDSKMGSTAVSINDPETRSTISSNELIPDYSPRMESTALIVAKLISRTLLLITLIISLLVLVTVYIQSKNMAHCEYGIGARESRNNPAYFEPLTSESSDPNFESNTPNSGRKIPISIRMSGRAGDLMNAAPNGKGNVNCVIERKTANQIIASEPKKLYTPYGNITTDPRLVHLTGEKLVFSCHSGDKDDKEEKEKDVIIITNNKEIIEPKEGNETDREEHESKENEADINSIKSREKRSINKELSCNCSC